MRYLVLLYGEGSAMSEPGSPEWEAEMAGYAAFGELAGEAIVGGEALHGGGACRTIRHDGAAVHLTDGPFAETVEGLGGFYVLEAPTLDDTIELVRHIPAVRDGAVEVRPLVEWFDRSRDAGALPAGAARYLATLHGPETGADQPDTAAWDEGMAQHQRFGALAGEAVLAGGALHPTATATTVRLRDGELLVTDGPFAEGAEVVGGLYVLAGTADRVAELGAQVPVNDGGAVELRPIMELGG